MVYRGNKDTHNLKSHEVYFIEWMIDKVGDKKKVTFLDLERTSKSKTSSQEFLSQYNTWVTYVKKDAQKYNFFENQFYRLPVDEACRFKCNERVAPKGFSACGFCYGFVITGQGGNQHFIGIDIKIINPCFEICIAGIKAECIAAFALNEGGDEKQLFCF